MKDLKIRVANEAESKEAQELFFKLGYKWLSGGKNIQHLEQSCSSGFGYLVAWSTGCFTNVIQCGCGTEDAREITLQELRDMVNPMKEYLTKNSSGNYQLVNHRFSEDDIEVPKGAEVATASGLAIYFWKPSENKTFINNVGWYVCDTKTICTLDSYLGDVDVSIIWQRHTQPEELPFMDSLNDQYAEIEQVRQKTDSLPEFKHDFVNHPKHYCDHPSGIECIEITRHHDFAIGNAIKYLWRAGLKDSDNEIQDLKKAVWYIQDKIAQLENK